MLGRFPTEAAFFLAAIPIAEAETTALAG